MNWPSVLVLLLVALALVFAVRSLRKHRGGGCHGCTGDCSQCALQPPPETQGPTDP